MPNIDVQGFGNCFFIYAYSVAEYLTSVNLFLIKLKKD